MAELRRTSVCWHTGLPPWRADLAAAAESLQDIVHVIRAPCDPERGGADKGEGRNWGSDWKKVAKRSVDDCYEDINALMSDGRARTFNAICVELYDKTSNILWKKNPDHALWLLVEDEVLKWTCTAPILFFAAVMEDDVKDRSICMHCSKDFEYEIGTEDGEFCAACLVRIRDGAEEEAEELSKRAIDLEEERDDLHAQVSPNSTSKPRSKMRPWPRWLPRWWTQWRVKSSGPAPRRIGASGSARSTGSPLTAPTTATRTLYHLHPRRRR
jgi:hypothetical protein